MVAALCDQFKWPHDFYRRMGWREFRGWLRELNKIRTRAARKQTTDPDSWEGQEHDGWWAEMIAKRERERGR